MVKYMKIDAADLDYAKLNELVRRADTEVEIENCLGHRFIACGSSGKNVVIRGVPGNALGAYLNGSRITVYGNAQDAVGDTMNDGEITVYGNVGDAAGYAMRGGKIFVQGSAGYRAGIHMKAYADKFPVMVIGKRVGSFLGEYQAGGVIIVLGIDVSEKSLVGNFCGTGMHGGKIYLRTDDLGFTPPPQVHAERATEADKAEILPYVIAFSRKFGYNPSDFMESSFYVLTPNSQNPYKQLYVGN